MSALASRYLGGVDDDVAGVLREIVEMVGKCDFVPLASEPDNPTRVVDRETGVSGVVMGTHLVADWGLLHEVGDGESSDDEEWSISSISSHDSESATAYRCRTGVCSRCHHDEYVIESRGYGWEDWLEMGGGEELICRSCVVGERGDFYCVDCGYSEALCIQYHGDQWGQFYPEGVTRPEYQDQDTRCQGCRSRVERYEREERSVNRVLFQDNGEEEVSEEWVETYEGELEPGEEEEDNNEEKAMRVKQSVRDMGELVFDIKDDISEGVYLKLMDGLQSITNEMNH